MAGRRYAPAVEAIAMNSPASALPFQPGVRPNRRRRWPLVRFHAKGYFLSVLMVMLTGCTSLSEYVHNGFKVGPNYAKPPALVASQWIDATDVRVRSDTEDLSQWRKVFNDPVLDDLVCHAYRQNLTLREAGFRVL